MESMGEDTERHFECLGMLKNKNMLYRLLLLSFFLTGSSPLSAQTIDYQLYTQGMSHKNTGQHEAAILSFSQFIQQYPSAYPQAYWQRGNLHYRLQQYQKAAADYNSLCLLERDHAEGFFNWGLSLLKLKQFDQAYQKFNQTIQLNPRHARAYNERGMISFHQHKYDAALDDFYKATEIDSTFSRACNNAGAARYYNQNIARPTRKDIRIARDWFSRAIAADSSFVLALRNRATMNILLNNYSAAIEDLQYAASLRPDDPMIFFFFGVAKADQDKFAAAITAFQKALELDPQLTFAYEELGNLYKEQKDFDKAILHYQQAKEVQPSPGSLYLGLMDYRIALVHAQRGLKDQSIDYLRKAYRQKTFRDMRVYRDFLKAKELKSIRSSKALQKLTKSIRKGKKDNHFLQPSLGWFRMRKS